MREGIEQTQTFIFPNAIVNVQFSELTEEKRNIRMKGVEKAIKELLKSRKGRRNKNERTN